MSTIANRLRYAATQISGVPRSVAEELEAIAAELEAAPAADAVEVVAYIVHESVDVGVGVDSESSLHWEIQEHDDNYESLVTESDHLSAIAALQAKIAELEARQVPEGWVIDIEGDTARVVTPPDGPGFITVAQSYGRLEQRILFALAKALAAPSNPTTQPPEGR